MVHSSRNLFAHRIRRVDVPVSRHIRQACNFYSSDSNRHAADLRHILHASRNAVGETEVSAPSSIQPEGRGQKGNCEQLGRVSGQIQERKVLEPER